MKTAVRSSLVILASLSLLMGCDKPSSSSGGAAASASAPVASAAASIAPTPTAVASAAPSAAPEPPHDCPAGSSGAGSFAAPCDAKGKDRMMEITWKKTDDKGPLFFVKSKSKLTVLYGKVVVYFYDKAGKQLEVKDENPIAKPRPFHTCTGAQLFGGTMAPTDKFDLTFSCVTKKNVPEGTDKIEAEIQMVGFADPTGKKVDFYWRNQDLTPEVRPKGGAK